MVLGELLVLVANKKKTFQITEEFINTNDIFKIKKTIFQLVK